MRLIHFILFSKAVKRDSVDSEISLKVRSISLRSVSRANCAAGSMHLGMGLNKNLAALYLDWRNLNLHLDFSNGASPNHLDSG
jgi:hypothetical protein